MIGGLASKRLSRVLATVVLVVLVVGTLVVAWQRDGGTDDGAPAPGRAAPAVHDPLR